MPEQGSFPAQPAPVPPPQDSGSAASGSRSKKSRNRSDVIVIHMWPKTPVLWPLAFVALVCAVVGYGLGASKYTTELRKVTGVTETLQAAPEGPPADVTKEQIQAASANLYRGLSIDRVFGFIFLVTFGFTMFALCIDTEIRWALTGFMTVGLLGTVAILINQQTLFFPAFLQSILTLTPSASPQFYLGVVFIWLVLMGISLVTIRFHYVKIESNEVFVVGGLLEGQRRFPTLQMKYEKDVSDVIEYYLPFVHSGRLILQFPSLEDRIVLDNVLNIDKVIIQLNELSSNLRVNSGLHR